MSKLQQVLPALTKRRSHGKAEPSALRDLALSPLRDRFLMSCAVAVVAGPCSPGTGTDSRDDKRSCFLQDLAGYSRAGCLQALLGRGLRDLLSYQNTAEADPLRRGVRRPCRGAGRRRCARERAREVILLLIAEGAEGSAAAKTDEARFEQAWEQLRKTRRTRPAAH